VSPELTGAGIGKIISENQKVVIRVITMRRVIPMLTLALIGLLVSAPADGAAKGKGKKASAGGELDIGQAAPMVDRKMMDVSGKEMSLADLKGQNGLLVVFSCNTCPFVIAWENRYATIAEICRKKGIGMVAVNSNEANRDGVDSLEEMKQRARDKGYAFAYVVDKNSDLANAMGATRTPHVYLFDRKLKLAYRGAIDDSSQDVAEVKSPYVVSAVNALAAGEEIGVKSTKSIGCSIKRLK